MRCQGPKPTLALLAAEPNVFEGGNWIGHIFPGEDLGERSTVECRGAQPALLPGQHAGPEPRLPLHSSPHEP